MIVLCSHFLEEKKIQNLFLIVGKKYLHDSEGLEFNIIFKIFYANVPSNRIFPSLTSFFKSSFFFVCLVLVITFQFSFS